MKPDTCKNCGKENPINYCAQCGQKVFRHRLTTRMLLHDAWVMMTNIESGFWYTTKMLFIAPWQVIEDVVHFKTRPYYHPFRYIFIWTAISVLISLSIGAFDLQQESMQEVIQNGENQRAQEFQTFWNEQVKKYLQFMLLFMVPFGALMTRWLFKKKQYSYAEHLVLNCYMQAQAVVIGLPILFLYPVFPILAKFAIFIGITISVGYYTYLFRGLFELSTLRALWKAFITWLGSYIMLMAFIMVVGIIVAVSFFLIKGVF